MFKSMGRKTISLFCAMILIISVVATAFILPANAEAQPIIQDFENITQLKNVRYFSIYEATSEADSNVYEGSKSLKWSVGSGTDAVSFWQSGMDLTVGQLYRMEMQIKVTAANANSMVLKQLTSRDNGWANTGKDININVSQLTPGQWSKYEVVFTAEQRAVGMYIYGSADVYFDYIRFIPISTEEVTVTLNTNGGDVLEPIKGAPGSAMTLPTPTKDGMSFAGWYADADLKYIFTETAFPDDNATLYAKWLPAGTVVQDFEANYDVSSNGFSVYTATDENDTNVLDGRKSLKWTNTTGTKVVTLWNTGKELTVGETYKLEFWVKAVSSTESHIDVTQLTDRANGWSYPSNTMFALPHFGTNYDSVGQWKKFEIIFTAEKNAMGLALYGKDDFYFDSITWTPIKERVTVDFVTNNGTTVDPLTGTPGLAMTLPTLTMDDMNFAGWYTDENLKNPFSETTVYPDKNLTLYAKWLPKGVIVQDFEIGFTAKDGGFSIYTATDENDTNVLDGKKSLKWTNTAGSKAITLWSEGKDLTIGQTYKLEFWVKAESSVESHIDITQLNDVANGWAFGENVRIILPHFGSSYDSVGKWKKFVYFFTAEKKAMGILLYGKDNFYFDSITWTTVEKNINVNFVTNNGTEVEAALGAEGMDLVLPTITKDGHYFAGWYEDADFTIPFTATTFPAASVTLYAKWIENGNYVQDFELWPDEEGVFHSSSVFKLYTATDENDPNVYNGKHSMLYKNESGYSTYALNIFDTTMGKLEIGEKYNVTIRFKPYETNYGEWSQDGTYHSIYYTKQQSNCWTYQAQGPLARYRAYVFYNNKFTDDFWTGTSNVVTTTMEKDENGWLTMNYEITAQTNYIALYMTGIYSMFIDYITIAPLPSGVIKEDYESAYTEDFYNILNDEGVADLPNKTNKVIHEISVDVRGDYIFSASLKKGANGAPKVYLAFDEKGENPIDGTVFVGNTDKYKMYSSRVMTDFSGVVYLVVEGGGAGSSDYFALFPTKYGAAEDPNPHYTHPKVNYDKLPQRAAASNTVASNNVAPETGDTVPYLPIVMLALSFAVVMLFIIRKDGKCNE